MAKDTGGEFAKEEVAEEWGGDGRGRAAPAAVASHGDFFGQPRGLATLFFTEFWERFSYYGMRALLVLFMVAAATGVANPGLGLSVARAGAIYGLYTFFVYVLTLPGGWVADNLWGARRSVFVGGCIIALGHFTMAAPLIGLPGRPTFFLGLAFIAIGTGLLKPNVSVMVGDLYPEGGARRDAGFSIFYMGINFGAILGPTLCSLLGEGYNWHLGFSLAGFGMLLGLISYKLGEANLGDAGKLNVQVDAEGLARRSRNFYLLAGAFFAVVAAFAFLMSNDALGITLEELARWLGGLTVVITLAFFGYLMFFGGHTKQEKRRMGVILWLFVLAALFWSGFEQAGSTLSLFAERETDRFFDPAWAEVVGPIIAALVVAFGLGYLCYRLFRRENLWPLIKWIVAFVSVGLVVGVYFLVAELVVGWSMPASMLQNINPLFIVLLAPVFGSLWVWLAEYDANPSIPVKFGLGLLGLAAGFFVISWGAANAAGPGEVSAAWLVVTYFLFTCGELALSPVGLSSITKLAPENRVSQMMGIWFVGAALGNLIAGLVAGQLASLTAQSLFLAVAFIIGGGGLLALLVSPGIKKLMGDVE